MIKRKDKYRIVHDRYLGYEVQVKRWWFPFMYSQIGINTFPSINMAEEFIEKKKNEKRVVKYVD